MADIVLGIGTSHSPTLSLTPGMMLDYAEGDKVNRELAYPPNGWVMPFDKGADYISDVIKAKFQGDTPFQEQYDRFQTALDTLATTLQEAAPDVTIIISDDQDEWLYENNMPMFSVYWGDTVPLRPRTQRPGNPEIAAAIIRGFGDIPLELEVSSTLGRHLIEYLVEHDFDMAHMTHLTQPYGGKVRRRYPTPDGGEIDNVRETAPHEQGLPHGFAFIIKRLYDNNPRPILPILQNTCYPPNQPTPRRSFNFGAAVADAVKAWDTNAKVAIVASGGLSHFVVDEEFDRKLLGALQNHDADTLRSLPRERLYSATSESLNWIALGGAMKQANLSMDLVDYVPVYRTTGGTGGGWAFARWQ